MFRVEADSLKAYFDVDRERKGDLKKLDALIRKVAPQLRRHFHEGTAAGEAGMRMKMIGYGKFRYAIGSGKRADWPVIGVALQKNYISVYLSITRRGRPIVQSYAGKLGEIRVGRNNFSFVTSQDLKVPALSALFAEAAAIFRADPQNPVRYREGGRRTRVSAQDAVARRP
ncbi:hypothetical protein [Bradyrhizobium sp. NP1]|jgi:hypothetical protein|uniref:hypothetical protein n=1 Tax=Bradyrhizobium sp. NP1 TaxID=3049772 RepID=UPI0025A5A73D|nr:hypothetical protein [Bradyrhizobium sp. NP1]WJR80007.1 hypothetical protein QOU61_09655 [Bradyrhizobium sp. NP1]